jgi:hypothetical protein
MRKNFLNLFLFLISNFFLSQKCLAQSGGTGTRSAKPMTFSTSSNSGVLLDFGVYYGQSEATANPSTNNEWKDNTSVYDCKLGYILDEGIYVGGVYSARTLSTSSTNTPSTTGSGGGVGTGFFWGNGFHLRGFYHFNEVYGEYKNGTGFQADIGYMMNMSSNFHIGFLISHRQVTFTENRTISGFDFWTRKETFPFITVGFLIK